jgi:hypothetical protein
MNKRIIVLDLETQRMIHNARRYVWFRFSEKIKPLRLEELASEFGASFPRKIPRKFAPWFSLLPESVISIKTLHDFVNDARTQEASEFYRIGYDPYWREIDVNLHEANPNKVGSPFYNRRLGFALAITWDKENGFREWWESQVVGLVNELSHYRAIVGANLMNFDYCVLERYVPNVRKRLGFRTVDILAHARWGLLLTHIHSRLRGKRLARGRVERIYNINRRRMEFEDFDRKGLWEIAPGQLEMSLWGYRVSLDSLAKGTLGMAKLGKALNAPALYKKGRLKELVTYCQHDVALTRDIFFAGCEHGVVSTPLATVPVRWNELVKYLIKLRRNEGPILEPQCLEYQYNLLSDEPTFFPLERLFRSRHR